MHKLIELIKQDSDLLHDILISKEYCINFNEYSIKDPYFAYRYMAFGFIKKIFNLKENFLDFNIDKISEQDIHNAIKFYSEVRKNQAIENLEYLTAILFYQHEFSNYELGISLDLKIKKALKVNSSTSIQKHLDLIACNANNSFYDDFLKVKNITLSDLKKYIGTSKELNGLTTDLFDLLKVNDLELFLNHYQKELRENIKFKNLDDLFDEERPQEEQAILLSLYEEYLDGTNGANVERTYNEYKSMFETIANYFITAHTTSWTYNNVLNDLAFSDYQKKTYAKNTEITWSPISSNHMQNTLMDIDEQINPRIENLNAIFTLVEEIKQFESMDNKNLTDEEILENLKKEFEARKESIKPIQDKIEEKQDDIENLESMIKNSEDIETKKSYLNIKKKLENELEQLKKQCLCGHPGITEISIYFKDKNGNTFACFVPPTFDLDKFDEEARHFQRYINQTYTTDDLKEPYFIIDMNDYIKCTGRPNGNISRTKQNLYNTLREMTKIRYEASYNGNNHIMIKISDVEETGNTLKVSLGSKYKEMLIKNMSGGIGHLAYINHDIFKLGHGQNKTEKRAKELVIWLCSLARINAKKIEPDTFYKATLKIKSLIDYLKFLNLLNAKGNRFSQHIVNPLRESLELAQEQGYISYETDAFKNDDVAISNKTNGHKAPNRRANFENENICITVTSKAFNYSKIAKTKINHDKKIKGYSKKKAKK